MFSNINLDLKGTMDSLFCSTHFSQLQKVITKIAKGVFIGLSALFGCYAALEITLYIAELVKRIAPIDPNTLIVVAIIVIAMFFFAIFTYKIISFQRRDYFEKEALIREYKELSKALEILNDEQDELALAFAQFIEYQENIISKKENLIHRETKVLALLQEGKTVGVDYQIAREKENKLCDQDNKEYRETYATLMTKWGALEERREELEAWQIRLDKQHDRLWPKH